MVHIGNQVNQRPIEKQVNAKGHTDGHTLIQVKNHTKGCCYLNVASQECTLPGLKTCQDYQTGRPRLFQSCDDYISPYRTKPKWVQPTQGYKLNRHVSKLLLLVSG